MTGIAPYAAMASKQYKTNMAEARGRKIRLDRSKSLDRDDVDFLKGQAGGSLLLAGRDWVGGVSGFMEKARNTRQFPLDHPLVAIARDRADAGAEGATTAQPRTPSEIVSSLDEEGSFDGLGVRDRIRAAGLRKAMRVGKDIDHTKLLPVLEGMSIALHKKGDDVAATSLAKASFECLDHFEVAQKSRSAERSSRDHDAR